MLIAALLIGLFTAYYFGLRQGLNVAGVALVLFVVAAVIPQVRLYVYGLAAVGLIAVAWLGPRRGDPTHAVRFTRWGKRGLAEVRKRMGRWGGGGSQPRR